MADIKIIALDMDGTLLDSKKKIRQETVKDIDAAVNAGMTVVLCTGRGKVEIEEYRKPLRSIRYAILLSGALLYDLYEERALYEKALDYNDAERIVAVAEKYDGMIHYMTADHSVVRSDQYRHMADYQMSAYQELFDKASEPTEDIMQRMESTGLPLKMLIYFRSPEDRKRGFEELKDLSLEFALAEATSLEMSPKGTDKGDGLKRMADMLDIKIGQTAAIGDAPNDTGMLMRAGYAVAMGNADDEIKKICDTVTADNDHNGAGNAIREILKMKKCSDIRC